MSLVVAITRPEPQAADTARRVAEAGHFPLLAPLFEMTPLGDPGTPDGIGAIAVTSRTGARLLAHHPAFHHLPVFAVGDATAAEARRSGFRTVRSAAGDVDALFALLAEAEGPIVHMTGEAHAGDLVERLIARGERAERRILYRMAPAAGLPAAERVDAVMLFSPHAATRYRALATEPPWRHAPCVALSPAVAARLPESLAVTVAEAPTEAAALAALATLSGSVASPG
ncbi:uroporphyrinogen-III synthase [Acuticoccus mangrovi]|uniref:Uroporphyrinogen-III synthase n=1 Tax=Acuticoccus mangrovi TaxID=2796142 RepID=A0A934ISI1_9HYPH|nr:uroporphyrinogen-III synthase [Acuticoccus mangrovi]